MTVTAESKRARERVALLLRWSIAAAVATIALKTLAWWVSQSVGLLSDAMESLVNLASAVFASVMVRIAARPADADHNFGHSKAEYFSSAFEGLMIAAAAGAIVWAAVPRFLDPRPLEQLGLGLTLSVASSVINGVLAWIMVRDGRQAHSIALEADGRHLFTDVWTSVGVVGGLIAVHLTGWLWLDPLIAIGVAVNILREGASLVWRSVSGLMDAAIEPEMRARVDAVLARFSDQPVRFDHIVTRRAGYLRFVDLHMHMPATWTLGRAAALRGDVEQALMTEVSDLKASIQLLPTDVETQFDRQQESKL